MRPSNIAIAAATMGLLAISAAVGQTSAVGQTPAPIYPAPTTPPPLPPAPMNAPPMATTAPIARPGNVIGTGESLPLSNKASNISSTDTRSVIAPRLPAPPVSENAPPRAFLEAARQALMNRQTGEAQEALERAESRALDGSVAPSQADAPPTDPFVLQVSRARQTLATGDAAGTILAIDAALAMR